MSEPAKPKRIYERAKEPKVTISVVLLESERDDLKRWNVRPDAGRGVGQRGADPWNIAG